MIKIVSITNEQKIYFMAMDPLMLMDRMTMAGMFALGALEEREDTHEVIPVGLMICEKGENSYKIHWLCVDPEYRTRGVGTALLTAVFDAASRKDFPYVEAHIIQTTEREQYCAAENSYLRDHYFTSRRELPGEWHTTVEKLSHTFEHIKIPKGSTVKALGELTADERKLVLAKLSNMKLQTGRKCIWHQEELFDPMLSRISYQNGLLTGGLLIQSIAVTDSKIADEKVIPSDQKILYPIFLGSEEKLDGINLIADSCKAAAQTYPGNTKVCVISHSDNLRSFYNQLMPDCHVRSHCLIAEVKEYKEADENAGQYYIL